MKLSRFLFGAGILFSINSFAATYYVATNGSDTNTGSISSPFRTIARGSMRLAGGDTLYIRAGLYPESMIHNQRGFVFRNGTTTARTRYAAYPGEERRVIIKPSGTQFVVYIGASVAYVEIRGLILDGTNLSVVPGISANVVKISRNDAYQYPQHNRIVNNEIRNTFGGSLVGISGPNEIIGNRIHGSSAYGIYASGPAGLIEGNTIYDCAGYGITVYDFTPINDWVLRRNVLYRNGRLYRGNTMPAVSLTKGRHYFYNNIVYGNFAGGVEVSWGANQTLVANNTIYGNRTNGIYVQLRIQNAQIINNISWGNGTTPILNDGTGTVLQRNLITDPHFVEVTARNFRLRSGSPAINRGVTLLAVPRDFLGVSRPQGGAYDIGAYEFVSALLPIPPSGITILPAPEDP